MAFLNAESTDDTLIYISNQRTMSQELILFVAQQMSLEISGSTISTLDILQTLTEV